MAGEVDVEAMLRRLTARQFIGWMHFMQLEPFGDTRGDLHSANVSQVIANVNRGKNQKPYKIQDFLLDFEPATKDAAKEQKEALRQKMEILKLFGRAAAELTAEGKQVSAWT